MPETISSKVDCIMSSDLDVQRKSREPEILDQSNNDIDPSITHALSRELSVHTLRQGLVLPVLRERGEENRRLSVIRFSLDHKTSLQHPRSPTCL
eukprot:scaffold524_cov183-Alexandrium_tamarense.AAC.6